MTAASTATVKQNNNDRGFKYTTKEYQEFYQANNLVSKLEATSKKRKQRSWKVLRICNAEIKEIVKNKQKAYLENVRRNIEETRIPVL